MTSETLSADEFVQAQSFVRAQTRVLPAQFVPEVRMHTADEVFELWDRTDRRAASGEVQPPPFWARPWAGGQALARFVLDHPETVVGRTVLDLASGSGLVAIAALRAGAAQVTVSEIDPLAQAAIRLNAEVNEVALGPALGDVLDADPLPQAEVLLVGDAFYERPLADRVLAFARRMRAAGADVLVGDPGRAYLPRTGLTEVAVYEVPVSRELENMDVRRTTVWRLSR